MLIVYAGNSIHLHYTSSPTPRWGMFDKLDIMFQNTNKFLFLLNPPKNVSLPGFFARYKEEKKFGGVSDEVGMNKSNFDLLY